jgi:stage II sporulation protein D
MRRLPLLLTALLVLLAATVPAADAATRHVVRGAGFGHGIGLSQYGAKGLAEHGRGYREIVTHYYRGTEVERAGDGDRTIRVLLQSGRGEISFSGASRASGRELDPDRTYRTRARGLSQVELRSAGGELIDVYDSPLRVAGPTGVVRLRGRAINGLSDGRYRGVLEIRPGVFGGLGAINALALDEYVKGVVPGEVPALWHEEALKAQAIVARSYALATNRGGGVFDQYPDTRSQVYYGFDREHPRTNRAVDETTNEIVTHRGQVIRAAFYFSTSGGRTENVENVFYGATPQPYLTSVEDPYDDESPRHRWTFSFTTAQMAARLGSLVKGRYRSIRVVRRGVSPRVVWADVIGSRGRTRVRGATLRARLGLHDTWAYFRVVRTRTRSSRLRRTFTRRDVRLYDVYGRFAPRPRGGRLAVERRTPSGGWRRVGSATADRRGDYVAIVEGRGIYRVRAGSVAGPAVAAR